MRDRRRGRAGVLQPRHASPQSPAPLDRPGAGTGLVERADRGGLARLAPTATTRGLIAMLAEALNISSRTIDRWIREGTGPPYVRLSRGTLRWRWGDVRRWMDERREGG
jgi:predicted DNA-binding transcriptional regulator AlpA